REDADQRGPHRALRVLRPRLRNDRVQGREPVAVCVLGATAMPAAAPARDSPSSLDPTKNRAPSHTLARRSGAAQIASPLLTPPRARSSRPSPQDELRPCATGTSRTVAVAAPPNASSPRRNSSRAAGQRELRQNRLIASYAVNKDAVEHARQLI